MKRRTEQLGPVEPHCFVPMVPLIRVVLLLLALSGTVTSFQPDKVVVCSRYALRFLSPHENIQEAAGTTATRRKNSLLFLAARGSGENDDDAFSKSRDNSYMNPDVDEETLSSSRIRQPQPFQEAPMVQKRRRRRIQRDFRDGDEEGYEYDDDYRYEGTGEDELRTYDDDNQDDDYEDNYSDDEILEEERPPRRRQRRDPYVEEEEEEASNFWWNPLASFDKEVDGGNGRSPESRRRAARNRIENRNNNKFRLSPIRDFYDRFFWYGFDPGEMGSNADPTMFGGTKGKFDGLSYLNDGELLMPREARRRRPRQQRRTKNSDRRLVNENDDPEFFTEYDNDDGNDETDAKMSQSSGWQDAAAGGGADTQLKKQEKNDNRNDAEDDDDNYRTFSASSNSDPAPNRLRSRRRSPPREQSSRRRRIDYDDDYFDDDRDDDRRVARRNRRNQDPFANWFTDSDDDDNYDRGNRADRQRRRRRGEPEWSPFRALDTFLGVDRDLRERQAQAYNRQMGLEMDGGDYDVDDDYRPRRRDREQPSPPPRARRRPGFAYKYDGDEINQQGTSETNGIVKNMEQARKEYDDSFIVDATPVVETNEDDPKSRSSNSGNSKDEDSVADIGQDDNSEERTPSLLSWEERALSIERVPPVGIPAWGPTGDLYMDARAKAIADALEDVEALKAKVQNRKLKVEQAREDLSIRRINAQLERTRWERMKDKNPNRKDDDGDLAREVLRELDRETANASRALRYSQARLDSARDDLKDMERRHWAVLRCYDPNQVEENMLDALRELEESEPAARRAVNKADRAVDSSVSADTSSAKVDTSSSDIRPSD